MFEVNEIVRFTRDLKVEEPFNIFAHNEIVTVIITAIDEKNKMCEVTYLHNKEIICWTSFENLSHIKHSYDIEVDFYGKLPR